MKTKLIYLVAAFVLSGLVAQAQSRTPVGIWRTFDDRDGRLKSEVEIYEQDGKLHGKVVKLYRLPDEDQDPVCSKCKDHRKDKKVMGMVILENMKLNGDRYDSGEICDPKNGKIYDCKIWLEDDNTLLVRGYVAFLYRTQKWTRKKGT